MKYWQIETKPWVFSRIGGETGQQELRLWDHTANEGEGQWERAKYVNHGTAIRYLGVMVAADGNAKEQTAKIQREVDKVLRKIEQGHCSMETANCLLQACVGGLLNYHGPFTDISDAMAETWDKRIREILRKKGPNSTEHSHQLPA